MALDKHFEMLFLAVSCCLLGEGGAGFLSPSYQLRFLRPGPLFIHHRVKSADPPCIPLDQCLSTFWGYLTLPVVSQRITSVPRESTCPAKFSLPQGPINLDIVRARRMGPHKLGRGCMWLHSAPEAWEWLLRMQRGSEVRPSRQHCMRSLFLGPSAK